MKRAEFKRLATPALPRARWSTGDALGTKLHASYIDVTLPFDDLPALHAVCKAAGVRAVGVSVLLYDKDYVHRRVCLTVQA